MLACEERRINDKFDATHVDDLLIASSHLNEMHANKRTITNKVKIVDSFANIEVDRKVSTGEAGP